MNVRSEYKDMLRNPIPQPALTDPRIKAVLVGAPQRVAKGTEYIVDITLDPSKLGGARLAPNTDVFFSVDASGSMYGLYKRGTIVSTVMQVAGFLLPLDADGMEVMFHSMEGKPHMTLGPQTDLDELDIKLVEMKDRRAEMGSKTFGAPTLRYVLDQCLTTGKNVFLEIITDGAFDDADEIIRTIKEITAKCDSAKNPQRFKIHFTAVNIQVDSDPYKLLKKLDDDLGAMGIPDIVDMDFATDLVAAPEMLLKEMASSVAVVGSLGEVVVVSSDGVVVQVGDANTSRFEDSNEFYGFESVPVNPRIAFTVDGSPAGANLMLTWTGLSQPIDIQLKLK